MKFCRLTSLIASILIFAPLYSLAAEMMSIDKDSAVLYADPGDQKSRQWKYDKGFPLEIVAEKGDWVKVSDFEGDTGWILRTSLGKSPHMVVVAGKNQKEKIKLRKGPGEDAEVVGEAVYGVIFTTLWQKRGWVKVRHDSGLEGWIKRTLLWGF